MLAQRLTTICLGLFILLMSGPPATAGAWPREKGSGFVSSAIRLAWPKDALRGKADAKSTQYQTFYMEYGLSESLTIGVDLGRSVSGQDKTVLFFKIPLRQAETGPKISAQLGFGRISGNTVIRPGLSLGWGHENGWLSFDAVSEIDVNKGQADQKIDMTWGRNLNKGHKLILQLQTGDPAADPPFARFAPSYVIPLNKSIKIEAGTSFGIFGDETAGIKIGVWASF